MPNSPIPLGQVSPNEPCAGEEADGPDRKDKSMKCVLIQNPDERSFFLGGCIRSI